jgi:hypothetical protein
MTKVDQPSRRFKGFEPAGSLLRQQIRKASEDRGFAVARLLTNWSEIAGPDVAPVTRPVKVSYAQTGFGATLTLLVKGASAPLIEAQLPQLKARVNACYGYNAIARIRLTQTAGELMGERPVVVPDAPEAVPESRQITAAIGDATLREALEALGNRVLSQTKDKGTL